LNIFLVDGSWLIGELVTHWVLDYFDPFRVPDYILWCVMYG